MLNKEICIKCTNRIEEKYRKDTNNIMKAKKWSENDNLHWKSGELFCRIEDGNRWWSWFTKNDIIPEWCPYKLEHILKEK